MILCDFRRVITISDKIDVGPLKIVNNQWDQCIDINQVYHKYQWADLLLLVIFFQLIKLYITRCHYELC